MEINGQESILRELKQRIGTGFYTERLPSASQLAAEFNVNVKTVDKALRQLVAGGQIERKRRTGSIIKSKEPLRTRMIEAVYSGFTAPFLHPFWSAVFEGVHDTLAASGYRLILNKVELHPDTHLFDMENVQLSEAAGRIVLGINEMRPLEMIRGTGIPMICAGDEIADPDIPAVYFDFHDGISDAVKFLWRSGCRRIGFIGHIQTYIDLGVLQKYQAYLKAVQKYAQVDPDLVEGAWPRLGHGRRAILRMLARTRPDALIVGFDFLVPEIVPILAANGVSIPVIGCDGLDLPGMPEQYRPIRIPRKECGGRAAALLLEAIDRRGRGRIGRHALKAVFE